ncbi:Transcriptional regulatory protein YehT [Planctomycetes bacterium Poly30]|uniref:Transcriptional regulatory protein YehT n=1 Tax=Saltatorellus ferox TaxID=2528018 RepID=A0A518EN90_9BACT|nr:Transcriptional regulatory protein YehT [Planctomycetes bacterium Poly30]
MPEVHGVLIVDDEPLARLGLRRAIEPMGGFDVLGECGDGVAALRSIEELAPDVVLLDIEMPEASAFDVLEALGTRPGPAVILVTAYSDHALDAFDAGAIDYVLKPVDPERLALALHRAVNSRAAGATPNAAFAGRVVTRLGGRMRVVPVEEIHSIEAAGTYVRLCTESESILHRESLAQIVDRLDPAAFARIHRSAAVALAQIVELTPAGHGDAEVLLRNGTRLPVSRSYRKELAARLRE